MSKRPVFTGIQVPRFCGHERIRSAGGGTLRRPGDRRRRNPGLGGAVLRGDLTWTHTGLENVFSAATSLSYSWTWGGKNVSGLLEYYYNGFGQRHSDYSTQSLLHNPDLLRRIERGELFTLARHYVAGSAMIEISPLFLVTPNLFVNLEDPRPCRSWWPSSTGNRTCNCWER